MKRLLGLSVLAAAMAGTQAWGQPAQPPLPPRGGTLDLRTATIQGNDLVLTSTVTFFVHEKRVETKKVDGKDVQFEVVVKIPVTQQRMDKVSLKDVRAFSGDGKPLSVDMLVPRLRQPTPVLTTYGGWGGPSHPFTGLLKDDAIVLVLPPPAPEKGPPPALEKLPPPPPTVQPLPPPPPPEK